MGGAKRSAILVGDIGGTNTRLAIIDIVKGHLNFLAEETFPSREEPSLESALRKFLSNRLYPVKRACFGVAGPVREGRCEATNLPWMIDSKEFARQLNLPGVGLPTVFICQEDDGYCHDGDAWGLGDRLRQRFHRRHR